MIDDAYMWSGFVDFQNCPATHHLPHAVKIIKLPHPHINWHNLS